MQKTRKIILDYLKERGSATVDELARVLDLTSVTVRHHLDILRSQELVGEPVIQHRSTPGRPQYAYSLTEKASAHFPKNYCDLAGHLIEQLRATAPDGGVNVIFEGVAERLAASGGPALPDEPLPERLTRAVRALNAHGYQAAWEPTDQGYLLSTCNCPYEALAPDHEELCAMDLSLVTQLLGAPPERLSRVVEGAKSCCYLVRSDH
jgi:predicted ArsR family transcriptional regulator